MSLLKQFLTNLNEQYANLHSNQPNTSINEQFEKYFAPLLLVMMSYALELGQQ